MSSEAVAVAKINRAIYRRTQQIFHSSAENAAEDFHKHVNLSGLLAVFRLAVEYSQLEEVTVLVGY